MEITQELKTKLFAAYLGARVKTPDYIGIIQHIDGFNYQIGVKYDCLIFTKNAIDGHDKQRSYGKYNITKQAFAFLGSDETEFEMPGGCYLILKPLSSITDEDATELACIHKWKELWKEDGYMDEEAINRSLIEKGNDMVTTELFKLPIKGYQFLQSKGYDLPQYLLEGKTLKEAALAIYEEDLKE